MPSITGNDTKDSMTEESKIILSIRQEAMQQGNAERFDEFTKMFRKQRQLDKQKYTTSTMSKDLDIRDRWLGIRKLKEGYKPQPYHRTKHGKHVNMNSRAEANAEHLAKEQWGKPTQDSTEYTPFASNKIANETIKMEIGEITTEELEARLRKFKRRKAPGPDGIPMEQEMERESKAVILKILNHWWQEQKVPEELLQARVVLIYKKAIPMT